MRLFIAINFTADTRTRLIALRESLRRCSQKGNFTLDDNLHLTLAFIGEVAPKQIDKIKAMMDTVSFDPFPVTVERLGTFSRGTLWWAGLRSDKPLLNLQQGIEQKLIGCGFSMDSRKYHPHITLGREVVTDSKPWPIEPFGETVYKIDLMKSERIGGKLTYTSIYRRGKQPQPIAVEPHNPRWTTEFEKLKSTLTSVLGDLAVGIHHVGSTSVDGLAAKPILDLDIEISDMSRFPKVKEKLATLGYRHEGDYGISGREAFQYDYSPSMEHHLYVCPSDSRELHRHLRFRDYLRSHSDAVCEYGALKQSLAEKFGTDIDRYIDGKSAFIEGCLARMDSTECR